MAASGAEAIGGLVVTLASTIGLGTADLRPFARWYRSSDRKKRYQIRKTFSRLRKEHLIELSEKDGETKIVLTDAGEGRVLRYKLNELKIEKPKRWDKKWRLVIFDIPEKLKQARNALRGKLNELGFAQLQKSVWVYPYECRSEIDFIAEIFNAGPYVRLIEANQLDGAETLKEKFEL